MLWVGHSSGLISLRHLYQRRHCERVCTCQVHPRSWRINKIILINSINRQEVLEGWPYISAVTRLWKHTSDAVFGFATQDFSFTAFFDVGTVGGSNCGGAWGQILDELFGQEVQK